MVTNVDVEQIPGDITLAKRRDGWRMVKFGDVVNNLDISERNPLDNGLERYIGLDHIDPESLHIKRWGLIEEGTSFTRKFVAGQVLFGKRRAYQRKVAVAEFAGICSGDILVFEAKADLLPELLPFIVQSDGFYEHALGTSAGSLSPRTRWRDLADYEFALPPKDEQRWIADILWAIDRTTERFQHVISAQNTVKDTLLNDLFELDNNTVQVPLGSIGIWMSGGTPSRSREDFWHGNIPWVSPKDMKVETLTDTLEHISQGGVDGSKMAPKDSILIVVRGMILAHTFPIAITGVPVAFNQDMKALVVSQNFEPKFVFYWLQSKSDDILKLVSDSSHGTKRLPSESLFGISIPFISREMQNSVVRALQECDNAVRQIQQHCIYLAQLKNKFLQSLL